MTTTPTPSQRQALAAARRAQERLTKLNAQAESARTARDLAVADALVTGLRPFEIVAATGADRKRVEAAARALRAAAGKRRR